MWLFLKIFFLLICFSNKVSTYNVLVYNPLFAYSHANYLTKISNVLSSAGHNVTMLMPVFDESLVNKTGITPTTDRIIITISEEAKNLYFKCINILATKAWDKSADIRELEEALNFWSDAFTLLCKELLTDDIVNFLKTKGFHAAIAEPPMSCGFGLFEGLGIPGRISAISVPHLDYVSHQIGEPLMFSWVPGDVGLWSDKMSMYDRLMNFFLIRHQITAPQITANYEHEVIKSYFGSTARKLEDMLPDVVFHLTNSHPLLDFPRPTLAKTIQIGGIVIDRKQNNSSLTKDWEAILSRRSRTVLVSFGSLAQAHTMPLQYLQNLVKVFASLPEVTFVWKFEAIPDLLDNTDNIILTSWMPQSDLLGDPRISLFITHGGLGSTMEVAYSGTPALVIPQFGDQTRNSKMLARMGSAVDVSKFDLGDFEKMRNTIQEMISNPDYKVKAEKLAKILKNQPISPEELVLKHVEFAAEFGTQPQMDAQGRKLNCMQYYLLDIVMITFILSITTLYIVYRLGKLLVNCALTLGAKRKIQ